MIFTISNLIEESIIAISYTMQNKLKEKLDEIAECIYQHTKNNLEPSNGLYTGNMGVLLFILYYAKYTQDQKFELLANNIVDRMLETFGENITMHTFCDGLSGTLYLLEFLKEKNFLDIDIEDSAPTLNNYLIQSMRIDIMNLKYDFMHGALGVGLYFLKQKKYIEPVHELIDFLYDNADKDEPKCIYKWKSILDIRSNKIGYNIALSHGVSSIVVFLSRVISSEVEDKRLRPMLEGAINYILSQEIDSEKYGCIFPSHNKEEIRKSRLGWCYGDLGIALALWQAGKTVNNDIWKNKALNIFEFSANRRDLKDAMVFDAGFCHGSISIAAIFYRMYLETTNETFLSTAEYWINQTLNLSQFEDGLAGYKSYQKEGWLNDHCLLMGISGIGLGLISFLERNKQEWDEILLMS